MDASVLHIQFGLYFGRAEDSIGIRQECPSGGGGREGRREGIWTNGKSVDFRTVDQWVCVLVGLWHLFNQPFPLRTSRAHPVVAVAVLRLWERGGVANSGQVTAEFRWQMCM